MPSKKRSKPRGKVPKYFPNNGNTGSFDDFAWTVNQFSDSLAAQARYYEDLAVQHGEHACGFGYQRAPAAYDDYEDYDDLPVHPMDSERGDEREPVQEDSPVAQLEVEHPRRAVRPFYTMQDLEDVDE